MPVGVCLLTVGEVISAVKISLARQKNQIYNYGDNMAITSDRAAFQEAAFADWSNRMGRRVETGELSVPPQIEVKFDRLTWGRGAERGSDVKPGDRLISDFVKLADATSNGPFLKFARRYGVFFAEELPDETQSSNWLVLGDKRWQVLSGRARLTKQWEPVEFWRELSRYVRAILRVAAESKRLPPRLGDREDWRVLGLEPPPEIDLAEMAIHFVVAYLVHIGGVGLILNSYCSNGQGMTWKFKIGYHGGLLGAIALQLALLIRGAENLYTCTGCGLPYLRAGKRPGRGQNNYCDACGLQRARRDADRRRKDKLIEARRLHAEGAAPEEIAKRLNVRSVASVRRWLKKGKSNVKKARTR
jgi:transposase-like protein